VLHFCKIWSTKPVRCHGKLVIRQTTEQEFVACKVLPFWGNRSRLLLRKTLTIVLFAALALPASAMDIIPCAVGNKWEYETVKLLRASVTHNGNVLSAIREASSGKSVYEVVSVDSAANSPVYEYRESVALWPARGGKADTDITLLKIKYDDEGLKIISTYREGSEDSESELQNYDPPLLYYSRSAEAGKTWDVGVMRDGDAKNPMSARGAGRETVTVPAGTFKDCLKVVYIGDEISGTMEMWGRTFTITSGRSRGIYWIADGVGVVKELEVSTSVAETHGPDGKPVVIEAASCTVSELKPGYVVKK